MMAHMAADDQFKFWDAVRKEVGPACVSWFVELSRTVMVWLSIGAAHLLQMLILSFGWSAPIVHWLDTVEECLAFATVTAFLLTSTISFLWATYRRTVGELK